ncbi:hypothetical protein PHMEG_00016830 [Phytophthora megakarya]|uniref:Uncharacterized protein n=1 Tax=Phytophthora megakarya TaxID=4795 RepID=A0A225VY17_9STRA|nr:hypothetical protein PHMEG_00016830 [Phytophthora megakarya]
MPPSYFYLRPGAFDLVGFSYGKVDAVTTRGGKLKVKLVRSGRWVDEQPQSTEISQDELDPRAVSEDEALDGAGTFVGSAICTSRVRPGGARIWDYGLVVGYKWESTQREGWLDVNFNGLEIPVLYSPTSTQDVAVEIYALQPCGGQSTSLVMASEMKLKHLQVYNMFNGIDQPAIRDSKILLGKLGVKEIDEAKMILLLDISSFEMTEISVQHVLDYVFYKEGDRVHPTNVSFGETIFDKGTSSTQEELPTASRGSEVVLSDGLSDSEDDEADPLIVTRGIGQTQQSATKRRRLTATDATTGQPNRQQYRAPAENSQLDHDVDTLIALQRGATSAVPRQFTGDNSQFQPTGMQTTIYLALVNGKYAHMTAQRFVEHVQIYWRMFGFFPHPAVLRALFGWDFGTRGLSILHFGRVTEHDKRARVRGSDMSNFSKKNKLPSAPLATEFAEITGAVEVLCTLTQRLYKPVVHDTLEACSSFLSELRTTELPNTPDALADLVAWVDDRLELFRVLINEENWSGLTQQSTIDWKNWSGLTQLKDQFRASHESFVRVHQLILRQDVLAAAKAANTNSVRMSHRLRGERSSESEKRVVIPVEVRQALPKQGKKPICLRFLSAQGCRGKNGICVIKTLCHFKPATLPDIVRDFINNNYGGLASDME